MKKCLMVAVVAALVTIVPAWDVEHDEVAQLTGEFLPKETRPFFTVDDFGILIANCHYPDEIEWTHKYHTLEDFAGMVGAEDAEIFSRYGFRSAGFLHREMARGLSMCLLARAFAKGEHARAAFYISELSHAVSDESALNHPPLLQYVQYAKYPGVEMPTRKVEPGAKNVFGFRSDGYVVHRVREKLRGYEPKAPSADFMDCVVAFVADCVNQADYAAQKEALIGFGDPKEAAEALADLVAMQVKTLEDMIWTAWKFRAADAPLPPDDFMKRCNAVMTGYHRRADPARQGVFAGIFDESLNPPNPRGTVGIVCDAYTGFAFNRTSYVGRMLGASCGRTLRKHGYAVKGIRYFDAADGKVPSPAEVGSIIYFPGASGGRDVATALKAYRDKGGRLIIAGGRDAYDMTGFATAMEKKPDGTLPVSECWENRGTVADYTKMEVSFTSAMGTLAGTKAKFFNPPNNGAFCKPRCDVVVTDASLPSVTDASLPSVTDASVPSVALAKEGRVADSEVIVPLVRLDNGQGDTFTIAARRGNVVWLPQYLLMPYLFQEKQPSLDFAALTLDPFAEKVLLSLF